MVMLGNDVNLMGNVVLMVMKDAPCYLYPCLSTVLSKVGEFCLPVDLYSSLGVVSQ